LKSAAVRRAGSNPVRCDRFGPEYCPEYHSPPEKLLVVAKICLLFTARRLLFTACELTIIHCLRDDYYSLRDDNANSRYSTRSESGSLSYGSYIYDVTIVRCFSLISRNVDITCAVYLNACRQLPCQVGGVRHPRVLTKAASGGNTGLYTSSHENSLPALPCMTAASFHARLAPLLLTLPPLLLTLPPLLITLPPPCSDQSHPHGGSSDNT
jgi:hypothetical protein